MSPILTPRAQDLDLRGPLTEFAEQGYARLGQVLSSEAAHQLAARAAALMQGEVRHPGMFFQHDSPGGRYEDMVFDAGWVGPSQSYRKLERLELDPLFRAWIENPLFERLAHAVLGPDITLYRAVLWNKALQGVRSYCPRSVVRASWSTTTPGTAPAETTPECPAGR